MAGYPVHRRATLDGDALDAQRPYVDPLAHTTATSDVGSDGFMNMSPVSTSGRQPLARGHLLLRRATSSERDNRTFGAYRRLFAASGWLIVQAVPYRSVMSDEAFSDGTRARRKGLRLLRHELP